MAKKVINEIPISQKYEHILEKKVLSILYEIIYFPIIAEISKNDKIIYNSKDDIIEAIQSGKINFVNNQFVGNFSAKISKALREIGAKWNRHRKVFTIEKSSLPLDVQHALIVAKNKSDAFNYRIKQAIDKAEQEIDSKLQDFDTNILYEKQMEAIDSNFDSALDAKDVLTIKAQISPLEREMIAVDYTNNMKLYIKNFAVEQIQELRQIAERNVFVGYRASVLKDIIKEKYSVTESKAKFLARQETRLLTSQYQILKADDAGIKRYIWKTSEDANVRHDHKLLDGEVIEIDNPPVVDKKTGRRAHAGEDFGCRCYKKWIVE